MNKSKQADNTGDELIDEENLCKPEVNASFSTPDSGVSEQASLMELTNQLVIIFGSFALGSLEHVTKLIKFYSLHEIVFNLMRILNFSERKHGESAARVAGKFRIACLNINVYSNKSYYSGETIRILLGDFGRLFKKSAEFFNLKQDLKS